MIHTWHDPHSKTCGTWRAAGRERSARSAVRSFDSPQGDQVGRLPDELARQNNEARQDVEEYRRLEDEIVKAIGVRNFELWGELIAKQRALGTFKPVMMHSYGEKARPVIIHGQMICDLATVVEIGDYLLKALP